jgi:hypothetical protein
VVEIPVFARIAKLPAVPMFTDAGPAAIAAGATKATVSIVPRREMSDIIGSLLKKSLKKF